jgi:cell division septation protein DedD/nucleoid DNA-binding protein
MRAIEEISELLIELLKKHNRISLPGMGAFVASPQAAVIEKGKIIPPSKKVAFHKSEIWNDGLLEQQYAERRGCGVEQAREELHRIIADLRFELDANGKVTLPGLGTLRQTPSRDVSFGLVKNLNLHRDSYGLDEVKIAPKTTEKRSRKASQTETPNHMPLFVLFCIVLAIIAALSLFFLLNRIHSSDAIEALMEAPEELPTELPAELPVYSDAQNVAEPSPNEPNQPAPKKAAAQATPLPAETEKPSQKTTSRCEFCTVVASFNTREGARIKAQRYKNMGYNARVVDSENNRYRVMLGCYSTYEAAKQGLVEAAKFVNDAWILEVCP